MKKSILVTLKDVLPHAKLHNYAIAQININNLEWIKAVLSAAQETATPVILGVSEGAAKYMCGFKNAHDMVVNCMQSMSITVPVVLHLDHGTFEGCKKALEAGFSSVMYDGSSYPIERNLSESYAICKLAKKYGASVEVEVGGVGGEEDGRISMGENANIYECITMSNLPIDALAASVGSIHGLYPKNWKSLNFNLLAEVNASTHGIPLVLHGGTGIPNDQVKKAIASGISKVNVNTECQIAFAKAVREYIKEGKDQAYSKKGYDPRKLLKSPSEAIKKVCIEKFKLFGSIGSAK